MKLLGIALMLISAFQCVKEYTGHLKKQLEFLRDWEKIFLCWQDWIGRFSLSIDELIEHTCTDVLTSHLASTALMQGKDAEQLLCQISARKDILPKDREIIVSTIREMGNSLTERELESLEYSINALRNRIKESENTVKERTALLYKLAPLLCGAVAVILW